MSTGFVLNIPQEMLNRLEDADKKIEKLAKTSEDAQTRIVSAFKSINTHGIDAFINKLTEAQTKLSQLGSTQINMGVNANAFSGLVTQAKNAIDEVNRVVTAISKVKRASGETGMAKNPFAGMSESLKQWNNLQSQIDAADAKIKKLTSTTMDYERQMQRVRSGQTTPINISYNEYAYTKERIAALQEEKRVLREKQEEITRQNNALSEQVRIQESLKRFVANQDSLPNRRSRDDYENLRRQLAEEEKASEKAEQKRVKDVEKAEKEAAKIREAERAKREKEEKATADRIAAYDSKARRERYKAYTTSYEGAMRTPDRAKTLLQEQQAIKNLEAARAKLNKTDSDYANKLRNLNQRILEHKNNIDKATAGSKNLQTQHRSLMDISGQLARRLALVFSVSQITGYVKKLIEVRGEFELQQRSLQAILQNKDEANRIWQQTVDLAVRSPFRVKELVSYTKQLAAYRIESDKLFETNKMLADISAGLGVDMQRLILAFGQVRSAAYLRGTELRQFTEAGIPILEQLAQYFTELEGRAVSVGDVFERVSKRMVSFADVEEIFKRMTAEGGSFYRMQEIQAETLKGMWSNLKDSVDIMVNEIGKGNESTLKNSLALVKQLVDNWRKVKPVIETVGISLMTYFGVDVLRKIGRALGSMLTTISAHPILAVASAFALLATYIWRAAKAQTEFNAAMSEVENENIKSLEDNIRLYHELRDAINDVTKSSEDREKAYNRLKSVFDDILPQEYLAKEYVEDLSKGYRDAEQAMTNYYDAKTQAQKKDRIEGLYAKELDTDISKLITSVRERIETRTDIPEAIKPVLQSGVSGIVNEIIEEVKSGDIANDIDTIAEEIQKRLEKYAGYKLPWTRSGQGIFQLHDVKDIVSTLGKYKDALEDIQGLPYETYGQKVASEWLNKEKESLRQISEIYKKLLSLYSKYSKATDEDKVDIANDISSAMSQVPENLNAYLPLLQESVGKMKGIAEKGAFEFTASMQTLESDFIEGLAGIAQYAEGEIGDVNGNKIAQTLSNNLQEGIKKASDKLDMTPFQNAVVGGARQIAARFGQDVNIFEKFIPNQKEALSNIRQEVKSQIESFKTQIKEMQVSLTLGMGKLSEDVLNNTQEKIQSMTAQLPALKAFLALLGETEKDEKKEKEKSIKILQRRISLLKDVHKQYLELEKVWGSEVAEKKIIEAYSDTFKEAFEGTGVDLDLYKVMTQTIVEAEKLGTDAGSALTEGMLSKLKELEGAGTYIRAFSKDLVDAIKKNEGFRAKAYRDAGGVWTQGYGETQGVERDKEWTREYAEQRLRLRLTNDYAAAVNKVLDANRDLIVTQEQYNALVDLAYQGGGGAVKSLVNYAKNIEKGASYIERISKKIKATMGEEAAARFGETFVRSFKEAETIQERMALLLQTMNLTIAGKINKGWYEGMQKRSDERAAMFSGDLDVAKQLETVLVRIAGMDFKTTEGMVKALSQLKSIAEKEGPEAQKILSQAISGLEAEIGLRIKKEEDEKLKNKVQELFDQYDLSLELKKLNIPPDLAKSLFDIEYLDLKGLKENVINEFSGTSEALKTELQKGFGNIDWLTVKNLSSEKIMEAIKRALKDIDDLEEKQQLESAKRFAKFLTQNLDQTKVVLQQRGIDIAFAKKEFDEGRISAEQFAETVKNIVAQSNKEISKFNLDKFKETPEYIQAMGDLASYSKKEIQGLIKTLNDAVTQNAHLFDADEVKAYMDALKKAQEELESRDVFKWGDFGRAADIIQTQKEIEDKKADIETNKAELETQKQKLAELQAKLDSLKAQQKATKEAGGDTTQVDADIAQTTSDIVTANEEIGKTNNEIKTNTGLLSLLGDKMKGLAGNMGNTLAIIDAIVHGINDTVQGINTIYGEIGSVMESFGKETDFSTGFGKGAMLMDTFAKSSQAAADGWDAF